MKKLTILPFLAFLSFGFAQSVTQDVLACTTIDSAEQRLACYDAIADELTPVQVETVNNWSIRIDTNPIDDSKTVVLSNIAEEGQARFGAPIALVLRCQSDEIDAYIVWNDYLGLDTTRVTYRIGTADAKTDTWYLSTDNEATFFSQNEALDRQFINDLAAADNGQLVAQVTPYSENPVTAVFNISGLTELLPQLFEPCP